MNKKQPINQKNYLDTETGEVLQPLIDKSSTGRIRPWKDKKSKDDQLANLYYSLSLHQGDYYYNKAERLNSCGSILTFQEEENNNKKLVYANSCRVKLCPICSWRRTLKLYAQTTAIFSELTKNKDYRYIFLTLTVPNCVGTELSATITKMMKAWDKLTRRKIWINNILGFFRVMEITHNINPKSKSYNTYHPHFHVVLVVDKSYFNKYENNYINQSQWLELWRSVMQDDTITQVNVKTIKATDDNFNHALAEVSKYSVKDADYIIPHKWKLSQETVKTLDLALHRRRLVAFGGIVKQVHKKLNLDDPLDGDLTHIDKDSVADATTQNLVSYFWHQGYQQYFKIN